MKERGLCKFYECHGKCSKGKDAEALGLCQHCAKWVKNSHRKGCLRPDNRRKIQEKDRMRSE